MTPNSTAVRAPCQAISTSRSSQVVSVCAARRWKCPAAASIRRSKTRVTMAMPTAVTTHPAMETCGGPNLVSRGQSGMTTALATASGVSACRIAARKTRSAGILPLTGAWMRLSWRMPGRAAAGAAVDTASGAVDEAPVGGESAPACVSLRAAVGGTAVRAANQRRRANHASNPMATKPAARPHALTTGSQDGSSGPHSAISA